MELSALRRNTILVSDLVFTAGRLGRTYPGPHVLRPDDLSLQRPRPPVFPVPA